MDKDKFLKKTSDLIIQENKIIIGLSKLKEVVNLYNNKVFNKRLINSANEKIIVVDNIRINKGENQNELYLYVMQIGLAPYNRVYIKLKVNDNNKIDSEKTNDEIEKEIENRKKYILQFKKDCLLFDEEIEDRNRILKMIDEYRNKYSYRLGVYFNYQTKYNY